jgi:hypothetical protein
MTDEGLSVRLGLIPVGVDIEAKAGDRLMIAAGVVIGVYTGRVKAALRPKPAPLLEGSAAPAPARAEKAAPHARLTPELRKSLERRILRAFQDASAPMRAADVCDALGFKEEAQRAQAMRLIRELKEKGRIETVSGKLNTMTYRIAGGVAEAA